MYKKGVFDCDINDGCSRFYSNLEKLYSNFLTNNLLFSLEENWKWNGMSDQKSDELRLELRWNQRNTVIRKAVVDMDKENVSLNILYTSWNSQLPIVLHFMKYFIYRVTGHNTVVKYYWSIKDIHNGWE